ncbi:MAG TPA: hypothetical protein DEP24_07990 [Mycobacterium sp.]|nr:hypothetical protein [Mycobacterium sp.]
MTGSQDSTRPISVAELLARNGTIGAPPVGGRRRRRRGNSHAVSVAELTGEIPVITDPVADDPVVEESDVDEFVAEDPVVDELIVEDLVAEESAIYSEVDEPLAEESLVEESAEEFVEQFQHPETSPSAETVVIYSGDFVDSVDTDDAVDSVDTDVPEVSVDTVDTDVPEVSVDVVDIVDTNYTDYPDYTGVAIEPTAAVVDSAGPDLEVAPPLSEAPLPRRGQGLELSHDPRVLRRTSGAEQMSYDPVDQSVDLDDLVDDQEIEAEELRSYLQSSEGALFSGETIADDIARGGPAGSTDLVASDRTPEVQERPREGGLSALRHGLVAVAQSVLAVVFGAGLFIGFDQLWRWNNIVALVLSVLVILGLVIAVRLVRKTEDIASTLTAVAVGALVTLGPLALLQTN